MESNRKILVVDDQEDLRLQVARMLEKKSSQSDTSSLIEQIRSRISKNRETVGAQNKISYTVDTVGQGKDAYELVKESFSTHQPYALMFLDMRMPPGWDGLETAQRIRSIDKEIQIVIMTAYADYEQQEIAEKIGEPDKLLYIKKPFHSEEVHQLALAMTEKWNMNRREKDRLILTSRLMRENSFLTRHRFKNLQDTYKTVLDAYISFLDAKQGILVKRKGSQFKICAASTDKDGQKLLNKLGSEKEHPKSVLSDKDKSAFLPIRFDKFEGFVYLTGKNLVYEFEQLRSFLEILNETAREVIMNATLMAEQQQESQMAFLGKASSKIAQRLDNTMESIQGFTKKLKDCDDSKEREELCNKIDLTSESIRHLSKEINEIAKPSDAIDFTDIKVKSLIDSVVKNRKKLLQEKGISCKTQVDAGQISGHEEAIRCCLDHLLINAIQALESADSKEIEISAGPGKKENTIEIQVKDSGNGIPEELKNSVYEPFTSGAPEARNGLGLSIVRQIIRRHNGQIHFDSEPGKTVFTIELPVNQQNPV